MVVFQKPKALTDAPFHYCPGCTHGIIHRLVAEVIDELGIEGKTIGVAPVGCAVMAYDYFACDMLEAAHGRAPAVATGVKRALPENVVFTYQGDGDLASIGAAEIVHAAMRGEKFTTIFINNAIYGMTGGQMAPTTLLGQRATTAPLGRTVEQAGSPIRMAEMLSTLDGLVYAERVCVTDIPHLNKAKRAIRKAFQKQMAGEGFTFIEVLAACPTNWGMDIVEANQWLMENTPISELIEDEGQKLVFEFDYLTQRSFFLELKEMIPSRNLVEPLCTMKRGKAPKQTVDMEEFDRKIDAKAASVIEDIDEIDSFPSESFNDEDLEGFDIMNIN